LKLGRELLWGNREVESDADHCPAVLGARLDQNPGQLAAFDVDVVGPLDLARQLGVQLLRRLTDS
jgi:hypothetical protein